MPDDLDAPLTYDELESERDRLARELYEAQLQLADVRAELAKTVSNFDEFVEHAVERRTELEHEIDMLRRINRELNDGNNDLNQLVIDTQRERDRRGDELRQAQAVIEAAKEWRAQFEKPDDIKWPRRAALIAAVDALEAPVPP